jgi:hypothetical protein
MAGYKQKEKEKQRHSNDKDTPLFTGREAITA